MENLSNIKVQRLTTFGLVVLFIILQTFFPLKGTGFFLTLPSIFMLITYKPDNLNYGSCFLLGVINDLFCMQVLGLSSIVFISLRFFKMFNNNILAKSYVSLLKEYLAYSYILLIFVYSFTLVLKLHEFDLVVLLGIALLQFFGFLICHFLWQKIFDLFDE